ncbi:MAG: hypothetical protein GY725_21555 [bacterium]|nr:hypothetical protein [bacterium]
MSERSTRRQSNTLNGNWTSENRAPRPQKRALSTWPSREFSIGLLDSAPVTRREEKPWGHEDIWAETDRYVGKILAIKAGHRLSLQYHEIKDETILVVKGELRLTLENDAGELEICSLKPGERRHVIPGRRHRFEAVEDCELIEVSSPELDDVVRLEDDYGRRPE